jgi:hypothetical protein
MRNRHNILFVAVLLIALLASCSKDSIHGDGFSHTNTNKTEGGQRIELQEHRSLLLLYSAGYNSISEYLKEDINDIQKGWIPGTGIRENILLIYSHFPAKRSDYSTPTSPTLTRISMDNDGGIIKDTLIVYPEGTHSATAEQLHEVLSHVKEKFPVKTYGMIFSSHASGYLPTGYYTAPDEYVFSAKDGMMFRPGARMQPSRPVPYVAPEHDPSLPAVKSIGQDQVGPLGNYASYEIELDDFAKALPMQMEYILFDACLMGGVEVAYELKDKCRYVGFSQAEVLAEGFDYKTLVDHLLKSEIPDPQAVCEDYFLQYDIQSGIYRSATISMVDCSRMQSLAQTCRNLFDKYRKEIAWLSPGSVQRYFRSSYHWFYDLEDILVKAGITAEELAQLRESLDECMVYKASTPEFMGSFAIKTYSGLSMYLPCNGNAELDKYYKTLQWNIDTKLVE